MPRVNVSRVLQSPKFTQPFSIFRKSGTWVEGEFIQTETEIKVNSVVTSPSSRDIMQIPEADRVTGVMCFHCIQQINVTNSTGTSDEILWNGTRYRIFKVVPWNTFGYWKAFGVSMTQV